MAATTLASWAVLIWRELEFRGLDARRFFHACQLDPSKMGQAGARYSKESMSRLWDLCIKQTADIGFGVAVGKRWSPTTFHALGISWLASSSLGDGLQRFVRYGKLVTDAVTLEVEDKGPVTQMNILSATPVHPAASAASIAAVIAMTRMLVGDSFVPVRIDLISAEGFAVDALTEYAQCPVEQNAGRIRIVFSRSDIVRFLPTANSALSEANDAVAVAYLSSLDKSCVSTQLINLLHELLPVGKVTEEMVARSLNMSTRTMQRRLAEEDTSFGLLYEALRQEKAVQYLRIAHLSVSEITYLLGYSEPANFTRACKRWFGLSPTQYRQQQASVVA
ncbi:MAG: AraC family transcriptional regulator ligand-binding domain-containing protein [Hahellaceae bacterium]|nr:AraC family transcriptional regulator ligand-binding domain-containing protein [Hahellaceae bacterium]MCP5210420.1 AraC family transcriptional regulator ligand-binding domain-containing protein [Hahellaceae bacterium]